jgi:hypothetical protein
MTTFDIPAALLAFRKRVTVAENESTTDPGSWKLGKLRTATDDCLRKYPDTKPAPKVPRSG